MRDLLDPTGGNQCDSNGPPRFLHFPLEVLEEAFGNCEVKLSRCDNDPRLLRHSTNGLGLYARNFKSKRVQNADFVDSLFSPSTPNKFTRISFKNCPYSEFSVVLVHDSTVQEGWTNDGFGPVFYANYNKDIVLVQSTAENCPKVHFNNIASRTVIKINKLKNSYGCGYCGMRFSRPDGVKRHQIRSCLHNENSRASLTKNGKLPIPETYPKPGTVLLQPKLETPAQPKPGVTQGVTGALRKQDIRNRCLPRKYTCTINGCGFSYTRERHLKEHIAIVHDGIRPFECAYCKKTFPRRNSLNGHIISVHRREKPYGCMKCGRKFSTRSNLNSHRQLHWKVRPRPHKCPHCSKSFYRPFDLTEHVRVHTGETPFQCTTCDVSFTKRQYLNNHMLIHIEKQHKCPVCFLKLRKKATLDYHILRFHSTGEVAK